MWYPWLVLAFWKVLLVCKLLSVRKESHMMEQAALLKEVPEDPCRAYDNCASCTNSRYPSLSPAFLDPFLASCTDENENCAKALETNRGVAWPHHRPTCEWCPLDNTCYSETEVHEESACALDNTTASIPHEYNCPLGPTPYPDEPPELLPHWMGTMLETAPEVMEEMTLVDWSLPGTHDSLTYDLSETVSDDGLDEFQRLAEILHALSGKELLPGELEEFFRLQAKTQQLTVTQQLDNGIRFIDYRLMMEYDSQEWYSIHFMQSNQQVQSYWQEIRDWLDEHPQEIVVLWFSRHGSTGDTGDDQYPDVTPAQKQEIWQTYTDIFDGLLFDTRTSNLYQTSVAELIRRQHRVVTFASDYLEFTNNSPLAMNSQQIQNRCLGNAFNEPKAMGRQTEYFLNAAANNAALNAQERFTLLSMNTSGPGWQIVDAAKRRFIHWILEEHAFELQSLFRSCASKTHIPGLKTWCPETLLDVVQLTNYYNQIALEKAWTRVHTDEDVAFPNAFYMDGLDYDGTIRTGTVLLDGLPRSQSKYGHSKYALVDTILAYNARKVCSVSDASERGLQDNSCSALINTIESRRSKYPMKVWDEAKYGRLEDWPLI